jgi:hypothetical protein
VLSTVCGDVHGAGTISTNLRRCGGVPGWATMQRSRPARCSVKDEIGMVEVELARMMPRGTSASSFSNNARLNSARSGTLSCT